MAKYNEENVADTNALKTYIAPKLTDHGSANEVIHGPNNAGPVDQVDGAFGISPVFGYAS